MAPKQIQSVQVLHGQCHTLAPVVFLSGGAVAGHSPYPNLSLELNLLPNQDRMFYWAHVAEHSTETSFEHARALVKKNWEAEIARIEMNNASLVEVTSGNPQWDLAFTLAQTTALSLLHGPTDHLPHPYFVQTRQADQGYSFSGDGSDYGHLWAGQTILEARHLCQLLLPSFPESAQELVEDFIATQGTAGFIDCCPSLNGKHSGLLATPLLCSLSWEIFQISGDRAFLAGVFHPLLDFINLWFEASHDKDRDGIPEWDHPAQSGFEDNPLFTNWQPPAQGADISLFESPALCAFLYRECQSLIQIAETIQVPEPLPGLEAKRDHLRTALDLAWDASGSTYRYLDRESHFSPRGKTLGRRKGPGKIRLSRFSFKEPVRLQIRVFSQKENTRIARFSVSGTTPEGNSTGEEITSQEIRWAPRVGTGISKAVYTAFEQVTIDNIKPGDQVVVRTLDYHHHDLTLLLPIWAAIPDAGQAQKMIRKYIANPRRYWKAFGLPMCADARPNASVPACESIRMPWNSLIGEGLLAAGHRDRVAELVKRLMAAALQNLHTRGGFRQSYNAQTGEGVGERNALNGLPPLALFLKTAGVQLISPWRVRLSGKNPFPWPIQIRFRGLKVARGLEETQITFPDGQTAVVRDPDPCTVSART